MFKKASHIFDEISSNRIELTDVVLWRKIGEFDNDKPGHYLDKIFILLFHL